MAGDYLAFAWSAADEAAARQAEDWIRRLGEDGAWTRGLGLLSGLEVWLRGARPPQLHMLTHAGHVLLGQLAKRPPDPYPPSACGSAGDYGVREAARLARQSWGAFVALIRDPADGSLTVYRDPSGAMDALTWRQGRLQAVASDLEGLSPWLWPQTIALDWDVIADFVRRPEAVAGRCALRGVSAVAPGEARQIGGPAAAVWSPAHWASREADAVDEVGLGRAVAAAVEGLAAPYGRLLVEVSGGFDSAVVLSLLHEARLGGRIAGCLNYYGDRPEGDERAWAEAACTPLGLDLTAVAKPLAPLDVTRLEALADGARPPLRALDVARDEDTAGRAIALEADAIVTGYGGDGAFFQMPSALVVTDYLQARGLTAAFDPFVLDWARWLRRPVWSVLGEALGEHAPHGARRPAAWFWGERTREPPHGAAHPWLEDLDDLPPAKRLQVMELAASQLAWCPSRRRRAADLVQPLLSQPVMEACLATPAWRLVEGGRDRAMARRAFAGLLPRALVERRSKGALTSFYTRLAAASLDVVRPLLLDGVLACAEVLDRPAADAALQRDRLIWRGEGAQLLTVAALECWVRKWQARVPDAAQASRWRLEA